VKSEITNKNENNKKITRIISVIKEKIKLVIDKLKLK
jgi:hypothetical protein